MWIGPSETNFGEILIEIHPFQENAFENVRKMAALCLGLSVLKCENAIKICARRYIHDLAPVWNHNLLVFCIHRYIREFYDPECHCCIKLTVCMKLQFRTTDGLWTLAVVQSFHSVSLMFTCQIFSVYERYRYTGSWHICINQRIHVAGAQLSHFFVSRCNVCFVKTNIERRWCHIQITW